MKASRLTILSNRDLLTAAALGVAGVLLAYAAIYIGIGIQDGFGDWDLHRTGRRLRRMNSMLICAAAIAGPFILNSYHRMMEGRARPWDFLHGVARALVHLPLWSMSIFLTIVLWWITLPLKWLVARLSRSLGASAVPSKTMPDIPILFLSFPFILAGVPIKTTNEDEEEVLLSSSDRLTTRRLLKWLPWLITGIVFWTGAVGEDSGERIDPRWLFAAASYWFADLLIVACQVAPALNWPLMPPMSRAIRSEDTL